MRRGLWLLTLGALVALSALMVVLVGGAASGQATARTIENFTLSGGPSPATYGKNVSFSIHFENASTQPLTHATFSAKATSLNAAAATAGTISLVTYSASQGTCTSDGAAQPVLSCDFGKVLGKGTAVDVTFVLSVPSQASGAASLNFDASIADGFGLFTNESGGDPGQPSKYEPAPPQLGVTLQTQDGDHSSDVLFGTNKTVATNGLNSSTTNFNRQSESLTPGTLTGFLPASIAEVGQVAGVCGTTTGVTPFLDTADISLQGNGGVLTIVISWLKSEAKGVNKSNVRMCHDGVILQNGCPKVGAIPPEGCVDWVFTSTTITGTAKSNSNGKWSGGLG